MDAAEPEEEDPMEEVIGPLTEELKQLEKLVADAGEALSEEACRHSILIVALTDSAYYE